MMGPVSPSAPTPEKLLDVARQRAVDNGSEFTDEHAAAMLAIFCKGRNVLITGGAGTGKTAVVRDHIIAEFERRGYHYGVCATTGIAGSHLSGRTIHSYIGMGLGPRWAPGMPPQDMSEDELEEHYTIFSDQLFSRGAGKPRFQGVLKRLRAITHLILDEVSMMPGNALLGFVDHWLKRVRKSEEPFGGMKMIFVGDFCQLPPVCAKGSRVDWAFMSWAWQNAAVLPIELTKIFRQSDRHFVDLLNRTRMAEPFTDEDIEFLRSRVLPEGDLMRTMLCSTNREVDKRNENAIKSIPGEATEIPAIYRIEPHHLGPYDSVEDIRENLMRNKPLRDPLMLKVGLPVLITVNGPEGAEVPYFNGSRARVLSIPQGENGMLYLELEAGGRLSLARQTFTRNSDEHAEDKINVAGKMVAQFPLLTHFPVMPASAISVHRSQGLSLDECLIDLSRSFAPGQVYVALSRLRTPAGLWLVSDSFKVEADKYAVRFYQLVRKGFYK